MVREWLWACAGLAACAATAAEYPSAPFDVKVPRLPAGGERDIAAWADVPSYPLMPCGGRFMYRKDSCARFAWDDEALYFAFAADDDDVYNDAPEKCNALFSFGDAVELFLKKPDSRAYWELHFAASGRVGAIRFLSRGKRRPQDVVYVPFEGLAQTVTVDGTFGDDRDVDRGWTTVCRVPFAALGEGLGGITPGEPLKVQVASVAYSLYAPNDEKSHLYSRNAAEPDPHAMADWCTLVFERPQPPDVIAFASGAGVTSDLQLGAWTATLDGRPFAPTPETVQSAAGTFVAWDFAGVDCLQQHAATMTTSFVAPAEGEIAFGASVDWFFDAFVDGEQIYSTGGNGNGDSERGLWNHTVRAAVTAGAHTLEVRLKNGMAGLSFALGKPTVKPVVQDEPVTLAQTLEAVRALWQTDCLKPDDPARTALVETYRRAIAMTDGGSFNDFRAGQQPDFAAHPALAVIDAAVTRALDEIPRTEVAPGTVVVWYLYNMGIVVKTPESVFGVDLVLPRECELAPLLDFLLVTHNHGDHVSLELVREMQKKGGFLNGKPVVSSFLYTPYFARRPQTFRFGDCTVETLVADHNPFWRDSITPFKVTCGQGEQAVTLVHAGDAWDASQLKAFAPADVVFCHVKPFKGHVPADMARALKAGTLAITHAQEMSHGFGPQRASYALCQAEAELVEAPSRAIWPLWGERFVISSRGAAQ